MQVTVFLTVISLAFALFGWALMVPIFTSIAWLFVPCIGVTILYGLYQNIFVKEPPGNRLREMVQLWPIALAAFIILYLGKEYTSHLLFWIGFSYMMYAMVMFTYLLKGELLETPE